MSSKSTLSAGAGRYLAFNYLYRDASNYKIYGSIWLTGTLTDVERAELIDCLDGGEFFVAEQIGVPPLYPTLFENYGGPNEDDHPWHTFEGIREEAKLPHNAEVKGESSNLLALFRTAKRNWHPEFSPNFYP